MIKKRAIVFLHIGWAVHYEGDADDLPQGKFGYILEGNEDAGEALNFKDYQGICFGYAPFHRRIDIESLGAEPGSRFVDNVLVVWTATSPDGSGRFVVGWYQNARLYASLAKLRPDKSRPEVLVLAPLNQCTLLTPDQRTFYIPKLQRGWPGVSSLFYASRNLSQNEISHLERYIEGENSSGFFPGWDKAKPSAKSSRGRQQDTDLKRKVEKAAVDLVIGHFERLGWTVTSVEADNRGWDLTGNYGARELHIEVKGLSGTGGVELTPNEYREMTHPRRKFSYRLAIVSRALIAPELNIFIFRPAASRWFSEKGKPLRLQEKIGGIATPQNK